MFRLSRRVCLTKENLREMKAVTVPGYAKEFVLITDASIVGL